MTKLVNFVKLYEVPSNTFVKVDEHRILFHHLDGMYSYCTTEKGEVCHLAAFQEVEIDVNQAL